MSKVWHASGVNPGTLVDGRYTIVRLIGRGAMADVFEARDEPTGAAVALKLLRAATARDPEARARFAREAQVQQMIRHPNVAVLHGAGVHDGLLYLAMELLGGASLARLLHNEKRLTVERAVGACWQALMGLNATHAVGVLHRDLKPGNLMLLPAAGGRERAVLIDFGFATLEGGAGLTQQGHVVGSLSYMAPERLRSEPADARSDLYGIGVILWEALVGRRPFAGGDDAATIGAVLETPAQAPSAAAPDAAIPPALDAVVLRALAKYPDERAASALAMAKELGAALRS